MPSRRVPRSQTRAEYWIKQLVDLASAPDASGAKAVDIAVRWLKSEFDEMVDHRPEDAESLRWDTAFSIALTAARLPRATLRRKHGLEDKEARQLGNPWAPEAEEARR
jgi:hypothetical protein